MYLQTTMRKLFHLMSDENIEDVKKYIESDGIVSITVNKKESFRNKPSFIIYNGDIRTNLIAEDYILVCVLDKSDFEFAGTIRESINTLNNKEFANFVLGNGLSELINMSKQITTDSSNPQKIYALTDILGSRSLELSYDAGIITEVSIRDNNIFIPINPKIPLLEGDIVEIQPIDDHICCGMVHIYGSTNSSTNLRTLHILDIDSIPISILLKLKDKRFRKVIGGCNQ